MERRTPRKDALRTLEARDLAKLGCQIIGDGPTVIVKRVTGDVEKLINKLIEKLVGALVKDFGRQEASHVAALKAAVEKLGGKPVAEPSAKFPITSATQVAELAYTVENLGASAYLGQAGNIQSPEVLASALAIHSVEARHAATLGTLVKKSVTPDGAFAKPADMSTVLAAVKPFLA